MPKERILIVEDDPVILSLCHRILEADGYQVVDARRGDEALAKLNTEAFDVLLTDIRLPGLTGLQIAQRLEPHKRELTIVTMTGFSNMEMAIEALSLGVDEFIVKPFTPDMLRQIITRALEKTRLRRENMRLRALWPLLDTATRFAAARTREQLYAELIQAALKVLRAREAALLVLSERNEGDVSPSPSYTYEVDTSPREKYRRHVGTRREDAAIGTDRRLASTSWLTVVAARGVHLEKYLDKAFEVKKLPNPTWWLRGEVKIRQGTKGLLPFELGPVADDWLLCAPLGVRDKEYGFLIALDARQWSESDIEAMGIIAAQAATALENLNLLDEIGRAYVNARELERLKGEFINITGHELRTPLAIILANAGLLRERLDENLVGFVVEILDSAERLRRIADDMLKLKYLEAGRVELRLERCAINEVVRQVVDAYRPFALEREQVIEMDAAPQLGDMMADRAMLDLMLGNLVSNAIKFSPRHARVRVVTRADEREVTFIVQDQGPGLDPAEAERIFDAFYQVGSSLTREQGGLGIGLTLTREMVRAHGGRIWVESNPHTGSSFYISLPRKGTVEASGGSWTRHRTDVARPSYNGAS